MTLVKYRPGYRAFMSPTFHDLVDSFFGKDVFSAPAFTTPAVNVKETPEAFHIEVAAPGLAKEAFKVEVAHRQLRIAVEQQTDSATQPDTKYTRREFHYHSFERTFTLPDIADADHISATYTDGILHLAIPKHETAKAKPVRSIDIA